MLQTVLNNICDKAFISLKLPTLSFDLYLNFRLIYFPTNIPRVLHVGTASKRSFPRRFNVEYT